MFLLCTLMSRNKLKHDKKDTATEIYSVAVSLLVWVTGLEPATPRPPVLCATKLRYTQMPKYNTPF